jgi:hypothetical protein
MSSKGLMLTVAVLAALLDARHAAADMKVSGLPTGTTATALSNSELVLTFPTAAVTDGFVKVLITGNVASNTQDHRLMLRINPNGPDHVYQSFVVMDGNAGMGEWDNGAIYLGRTGWGLDSSFSAEVTVAVHPGSSKITTSGMSTFGMSNNTILGYHNNGFLVTNQPITQLDFYFSGPNPVVDATMKVVVY